MNSECRRIADQLRRAFSGDPWHGSPLRELLDGVSATQANQRPLASAHTVWELVLHIDIYLAAALGAIRNIPMPKLFETQQDWPAAGKSASEWGTAVSRMFADAEALAAAIERFTDLELTAIVPGRDYDFYYLFHGIVQHSLYHGGQIAMLKKSLA